MSAQTTRPLWKDPSSGPAVAGLVIKVAQYTGQQISADFAKSHQAFFDFLSFLSMALFGVALVLWLWLSNRDLSKSRQQLEKMDTIAERVEQIKQELDTVDWVAKYGSGSGHLASLLRAKNQTHAHAGGETLADVLLTVYAKAATDLYSLSKGGQEKVELVEYHVIDKFLLNLMKALPDGSVWLGVTRLQDTEAWKKESAEPSYFEFQDLVERRTKSGSLRYFRLWNFDSESRQKEALKVVEDQARAGVEVRTCVSSRLPDMSLIWVPPSAVTGTRPAVGVLFEQLREVSQYQPLCAIEFMARGGKDLDAMTLYASCSERFTELRFQFMKGWSEAQALNVLNPPGFQPNSAEVASQ